MSDTDNAGETDPAKLGVPEDALKRRAEMRPGSAGALFTSDLSVNEFLLVRDAGFHPFGLVLGSSIYPVGLPARRQAPTASSGSGSTSNSRSSATTSPSSSPSGPPSPPTRRATIATSTASP